MRPAASIAASGLLLAATTLTWAGVLAIIAFCLLAFDAQRRAGQALAQLDGVNQRLDAQKDTLDQLQALVTGDGDDGGQ